MEHWITKIEKSRLGGRYWIYVEPPFEEKLWMPANTGTQIPVVSTYWRSLFPLLDCTDELDAYRKAMEVIKEHAR